MRQRRSTDEVDSRILDSAQRLFAEKGFSRTSLRMIAEDAGATESAIFRRFRNKDRLFRETVLEPFRVYIQEFWQADAHARPENVPVAELVRDFILGFYRMMREQRSVVITLIEANEYESLQGLQENLQEFVTAQEMNFNELAKAGRLPGADIELTVRVGFALIMGLVVLDFWLLPEHLRDEHDRISEEMITYSLYGILGRSVTTPGR